jgi:predicted RNase H-like HicB family nuclease/predicted RNA binding protein YcfA (HicA-like mRNA interferase family)
VKVREVIRLLEEDGRFLVATEGSHRQCKHPLKPGPVTVAGKSSDDLAPGNPQQHPEAIRAEGEAMMRCAVAIEKADQNYSAYVPDLPGCVATGPTLEAIEAEIAAAIRFHIEGLKADGLEVPAPTSIADYVEA